MEGNCKSYFTHKFFSVSEYVIISPVTVLPLVNSHRYFKVTAYIVIIFKVSSIN